MPKPNLDPELRKRLKAEVKSPGRGFRKVFYSAFAASALVGSFIFGLRLLAGTGDSSTVPNLALQLGIVGLMIGLLRWEQRSRS
jgi:hypothetical protein